MRVAVVVSTSPAVVVVAAALCQVTAKMPFPSSFMLAEQYITHTSCAPSCRNTFPKREKQHRFKAFFIRIYYMFVSI